MQLQRITALLIVASIYGAKSQEEEDITKHAKVGDSIMLQYDEGGAQRWGRIPFNYQNGVDFICREKALGLCDDHFDGSTAQVLRNGSLLFTSLTLDDSGVYFGADLISSTDSDSDDLEEDTTRRRYILLLVEEKQKTL